MYITDTMQVFGAITTTVLPGRAQMERGLGGSPPTTIDYYKYLHSYFLISYQMTDTEQFSKHSSFFYQL